MLKFHVSFEEIQIVGLEGHAYDQQQKRQPVFLGKHLSSLLSYAMLFFEPDDGDVPVLDGELHHVASELHGGSSSLP